MSGPVRADATAPRSSRNRRWNAAPRSSSSRWLSSVAGPSAPNVTRRCASSPAAWYCQSGCSCCPHRCSIQSSRFAATARLPDSSAWQAVTSCQSTVTS